MNAQTEKELFRVNMMAIGVIVGTVLFLFGVGYTYNLREQRDSLTRQIKLHWQKADSYVSEIRGLEEELDKTNRAFKAYKANSIECPDCRRIHEMIHKGTEPQWIPILPRNPLPPLPNRTGSVSPSNSLRSGIRFTKR